MSVGLEGFFVIFKCGFFVIVSEEDNCDDVICGLIMIYKLIDDDKFFYLMIVFENWFDGSLIFWVVFLVFVVDKEDVLIVYVVYDSFFVEMWIFKMDVSDYLVVIIDEIVVMKDGVLVSVDGEGLVMCEDGGFWVVLEGVGNFGDEECFVELFNMFYFVDEEGVV